MDNVNYDVFLKQLNSGQNPTPSTNDSGLATSERGKFSGTRESQFGLRAFNEGARDSEPTSEK